MISAIDIDYAPPRQSWQWRHHQFWAMNTGIFLRLLTQTDSPVLEDVEQLFISFERRLSRFLPDSDLSRLNDDPRDTVNVSPTLLGAVENALHMARITNGLYDPTILNFLEAAGYRDSFETLSRPQPLTTAVPLAALSAETAPAATPPFTYRSVHVNRAANVISRPAGLKLDLGGMGKGWTVDRAADRLQELGPFFINAGGDIFAYQSPPGERGWLVELIHPLKPSLKMARLYLHHQALATSTIAKRRWQHNGQIMHHLINPRTGHPAQTDALSVTVIAQRTVLAEVYAKTALILGAEAGLAYLQQLPQVEGLIFTNNQQIIYTDGLTSMLERVTPDGYQQISQESSQ